MTPAPAPTALPAARRTRDVVEPLAAAIYFSPEAHAAYQELGLGGSSREVAGIHHPDMVAYFTSRGACLGPHVSGQVVAARGYPARVRWPRPTV